MEPFHIFLLVISLAGQPVGVMRYTGNGDDPNAPAASYTDKEACKANMEAVTQRVQNLLDTSDNPEVKGFFAIADAKCATNREMGIEPENGA